MLLTSFGDKNDRSSNIYYVSKMSFTYFQLGKLIFCLSIEFIR